MSCELFFEIEKLRQIHKTKNFLNIRLNLKKPTKKLRRNKYSKSSEKLVKSVHKVFQKTHKTMSYAYLFKYIIIGDTGEHNRA